MALATRCPHCKTTFRVASDQLKLRGGIVRCGTCNQVFDGNATLVDLDAPAPGSVPAAPEIPAWLARTNISAPSDAPAPADDAPIPAWLARAMDAEVKVEPVVDIAFEPIVFKRDAEPASEAPPPAAEPVPDAAPEAPPSKFELVIEPDLLTDTIGSAEAAPVGDAGQGAAPLVQPEPEPVAEPEPEAVAEPEREPAPEPEAEPEPVAAPDPLAEPEAVAEVPAEPVPLPEADAPRVLTTVPPVLDFDLSQDPDPKPVYDEVAFKSPSAAVDVDFASFDDPVAVRLPRDYVLDYDLSDPPGWVPDAPPAPARPPVYEAGPDTELGPLYETEEETHYDLELEQPPVDELLELSVADEVEFSSVDADSQLPPVTAELEAEPVAELEAAPVAELEAAPVAELEAAPEAAAEPEPEAAPEPEPEPEPAAEPPAVQESGPLPLLRESAAPEPAAAETAAAVAPAIAVPKADAETDEPEFVRLAREKELASRRRTVMLGAGTAVLALALLAQGVTTFRDVLAAKYPALKPAMTTACALLRCKVELPAQLDALKIEAPELQSLGNNTFVLTTLLRNESGLIQAWPYIHLELTDANDKPLVRRVFTPAQYLPGTVAPAKGFAATSEQPVKIHFELKQLKASGFHVAVFYP